MHCGPCAAQDGDTPGVYYHRHRALLDSMEVDTNAIEACGPVTVPISTPMGCPVNAVLGGMGRLLVPSEQVSSQAARAEADPAARCCSRALAEYNRHHAVSVR